MPQLPPTLLPANLPRTLAAKVPLKAARDLKNRMLFGPMAPKSDECIFVDPREMYQSYKPRTERRAPKFRRWHSGLVRGGDWDRSVAPYKEGIKEVACRQHFHDGVPWRETGLLDHLMADIHAKGSADGCRSLRELEIRYENLDRLYEDVLRTGRFARRRELSTFFRREHGGVYFHISRDGTPLRAGGGIHRLAIARLAGLRRIPAQLGVFHREALRDDVLARLRSPD